MPSTPACLSILGLCLLAAMPAPAQNDDLKPWPVAEEGYKRFVFRLPKLEDESERKVELVIGKTLELDERNRYFIGGTLERKTIKGWGYSYHHLTSNGQVAGTRMAVPPGAPKVKRFVQVRSDNSLIRYNSKLPVVVYVPEGFEVKYRIWSAGETSEAKVE